MPNLKYAIVWLVFILAHMDLELIQCSSIQFEVLRCPLARPRGKCPEKTDYSCKEDKDCEAHFPGKGLKCCMDCIGGNRGCVTPVRIASGVEVIPLKVLNQMKLLNKLVAECPTSPPSWPNPSGPDQECQDDASCDAKFPGQGLKCCSDFRCIPPVIKREFLEAPSFCPIPSPSRPGECSTYFEDRCLEHLYFSMHPGSIESVMCCITKCGNWVWMIAPSLVKVPPTLPFPRNGTCPIISPPKECQASPSLYKTCKVDQDCYRKLNYFIEQKNMNRLVLKCCNDGCGHRKCIPPIIQ